MQDFKIFDWLEELEQWGGTEQGIMRLAFSEAEKGARTYVIRLMQELDMEIRVDEAANIIGRYQGLDNNSPAVVIGSHLDSVPRAGRYDGVLGVLAGLEVIRYLKEHKLRGTHPLEIIVFTNEEGCRFPCTLFGSSVVVGYFKKQGQELKEIKDSAGINLYDVLLDFGGNPAKLLEARRSPKDLKAYLELHIEQGLVLEEKGAVLGIVEAIAAPVRYSLKLTGSADHAGATPMSLRKDALLGGAEIMLALERITREVSPVAVGTVGQVQVLPGAVNIIPGEVVMTVEVRHIEEKGRDVIISCLEEEIKEICVKRGLGYELEQTFAISPVTLDPQITSLMAEVCQEKNIPALAMVSGAAHDAMVMAGITATGMIFVPSVGGISHNPQEYTKPQDIKKGVEVLREVAWRLIK